MKWFWELTNLIDALFLAIPKENQSTLDSRFVQHPNLICASQQKQLQLIQNRACRIVLGLSRREPVDEHLKKLHWLKIHDRIVFKILLLVFKSLTGVAPSYLSELLNYENFSRIPVLHTPKSNSPVGDKAFVSCGPRLWNELPSHITQCESQCVFKSMLKTYLFKKSYDIDINS